MSYICRTETISCRYDAHAKDCETSCDLHYMLNSFRFLSTAHSLLEFLYLPECIKSDPAVSREYSLKDFQKIFKHHLSKTPKM